MTNDTPINNVSAQFNLYFTFARISLVVKRHHANLGDEISLSTSFRLMHTASRDKSALSIYRIRIPSAGEISIIATFLVTKFIDFVDGGSSVNKSCHIDFGDDNYMEKANEFKR